MPPKAAAADREIKQAGNAAHRQRTGEFLQLIELAGEITTAHQRSDRRAGDHADLHAGLVQRPQDADMGPAAGRAAAKGERYAVFVDDLGDGRLIAGGFGISSRKMIVTISPSQHDRTPCQFCEAPPLSPEPAILVANWCGRWKVAVYLSE